jgi:hypothetical protein
VLLETTNVVRMPAMIRRRSVCAKLGRLIWMAIALIAVAVGVDSCLTERVLTRRYSEWKTLNGLSSIRVREVRTRGFRVWIESYDANPFSAGYSSARMTSIWPNRDTHWESLGFSNTYIAGRSRRKGRGIWPSHMNVIVVGVPMWPIFVLIAVPPALRLVRSLRWRRLVARSTCVRCGYDLTATPWQCPECGAFPPVAQFQRMRRKISMSSNS